VLFIREIDLEKSVRILAILSDKEGSRIIHVNEIVSRNRPQNKIVGQEKQTRGAASLQAN
jgi:hypothetical protein